MLTKSLASIRNYGKDPVAARLMAAGQDGVDGGAEMSVQRGQFGGQDRHRLRKLNDGRPFAVGRTASPVLAGTTRMSPRPLTAGGWSRDVGARRSAAGCPDISCAGYRA